MTEGDVMRKNRLTQMITDKSAITNAWLWIPSGYLAEGAGHQGFDSVTVDLQHGLIGLETAVTMLQAISATPAIPLVRAPSNDDATIMHPLDAGAYGVICPMALGLLVQPAANSMVVRTILSAQTRKSSPFQ